MPTEDGLGSAEALQTATTVAQRTPCTTSLKTTCVSAPLQRLDVEKITGHQSIRGRGGVIVVMYKTHWAGLSDPSWEREKDLQLPRPHIVRCWAGTPDQHRQTDRLYRRMSIGAAQCELSRSKGECFLSPGYACVSHEEWLRRFYGT